MSGGSRLPVHLTGRVQPCPVDRERVRNLLARSEKDLKTAGIIRSADPEAAYSMVYESMLHAGLAFLAACGFRADVAAKHKTVVDFAEHRLGADHKELVEYYDRMRRKRHQFIYEPGPYRCTDHELTGGIKMANKLLALIQKEIVSK